MEHSTTMAYLVKIKLESGEIKNVRFNGPPKNLMVNRLLMSLMFGLDSVELLQTDEMKKRYVELKAKKV